MICNYTNVNDFCSNKYSYAFIDVVQSGAGIITNKSENAPVLRTDKITGQTKIINQFSNDFITTCNINDDNEETTEWECYLIYRYIASGTINDPPLQTFKDAQINLINTSYNSTIEDGIAVNINNQNIILGSSIADQMSYKSILSYAQVLYDDDNDASMPSFNDKNGNIYTLPYADLIIVFKTYLEKIILYKNLKDTLVGKCINASSVDDIQQLNWCKTKPITGSLINTTISTIIEKPVVQTCLDIESATSSIDNSCDPPCDPNNCETCNNGSCVDLCQEGQYCCDGVCQNDVCCSGNVDCIEYDYGCCVNGECIASTDAGIYNGVDGCPAGWNYAGDVIGNIGLIYCCPPTTYGPFPSSGKCC